MSKVKALYHIVFCTKAREMTIAAAHAEDGYRFIWKEISDQKCRLIRIGGIRNHIHMLVELHPSVALAYLMQLIKGRTSAWMGSDGRFPNFRGWASEYYAGTISPEQQGSVIEYIKNQERHHLGVPFDREMVKMYRNADLLYHPNDMI